MNEGIDIESVHTFSTGRHGSSALAPDQKRILGRNQKKLYLGGGGGDNKIVRPHYFLRFFSREKAGQMAGAAPFPPENTFSMLF
jgi:hypothetical protein